ncbi:MAG: hypothetical protein ACD_56C00146G0019 [uncultured bacterium]|nr:MAG: hypothetical protein ACD_56C00146G0019 [uncultured bacterium]
MQLTLIIMAVFTTLISACAPDQTAQDKQREAQEKIVGEGVSKVGMPNIVNFREAKAMRMIQELCDQEIVTYTYLENMSPVIVRGHTALGGKLTYLGETISYPIPYSAQFTAPESMQTYNISSKAGEERKYGVERLPQPDPNGLHKPGSAEATFILMKDPSSDKVAPVYTEPKLLSFPFKLKMD